MAISANNKFLKDIIYGGKYNPALGIYTGSSKSSNKSSGNNKYKTYKVVEKQTTNTASPNLTNDVNAFISSLGGSSSSGGGRGVSAGSRIDLTPYINSLKEGAANQKKTISDSYKSLRNQLTQALKAEQENTAIARRQAMEAFNASRADLEENAYMNARAAQQSAASRGLGGSGLQQLAQLSSQIESSKQTSDLAETNTNTQNDLTKALKDYSDKINTQITDYTTEERNKLAEIDSNVASAIAQKQYEEEVRYQQALQNAAATNASIAASTKAASNEQKLQIATVLASIQSAADSLLNEGTKAINNVINKKSSYKTGRAYEDALQKQYDKYEDKIRETIAAGELGSDLGNQYTNYYLNQLSKAYNKGTGSILYQKSSGLAGLLGGYTYRGDV